MDLFAKCDRYLDVRRAVEEGIYPYFKAVSETHNNRAFMEGQERLMLGSNNYLGLTDDPRVKEAAIRAIERYGTGCTGSRFLNGTLDLHLELEEALKDFMGTSGALICSTGFQTNLSIITAVTDRHDVILSDDENHASIVDACRLSHAKCYKYRHSDMEHLKELLERVAPTVRGGILIVSDGVFSMKGDLCRLPELVALKKAYNARLLIDDAHALGVVGPTGRGTGEHFGLEKEIDLVMHTFSKSLASLGGAVVGDATVVDFIRHRARPFIFSASVPPAQVAAARMALKILEEEPWRLLALREGIRRMKEGLKELSTIQLIESGNEVVPILPLLTETTKKTLLSAAGLYEVGLYVNPVLPPAVPEGEALLRTSLTATMDETFIDEALERFKRFRLEGLEDFPVELL